MTLSTPKKRTLTAIALFLPLAALLLTLFACLPVPIGDPEKSKVDNFYLGGWSRTSDIAGTDVNLVVLKKWDDKTFIVHFIAITTKDGKEERETSVFKAWLTNIGGQTFITAQPMDPAPADPIYWAVLRLDKTANGISMSMVNPDSDLIKAAGDKPTSAALEAIIKASVNDKTLYGDPSSYKKVDEDKIEEIMKRYNEKP